MKYFTQEIDNKKIFIVLIAEFITTEKSLNKYQFIRETNANVLGVDINSVVLACIKNGELNYVYGQINIINKLDRDKKSNIEWIEK